MKPYRLPLCLLFTALLAACGDKPAAAPAAASAPPPAEVEVITVSSGSATLTQDLPGRLQAYRSAQVRARVEGIIEKRLFQEGSEVKAGQPLFHIDARTNRAARDAARADVEAAALNAERMKSLLEIKAVSQQDYDLAKARAKQAQAALIRTEEDLENAQVPAAISGHIGRAMVTEGAYVSKADATPLATIEQLDPIYANFSQSSADLLRLQQAVRAGKLKNSDSVKVELLLEDGSIYSGAGKIFFKDLSIDPNTGAVAMRAEFPNPKHELLPGQFVRISFPQAVAENTFLVPQRAVQSGTQGQFVTVVGAENKLMPVPVKTGGMSGTNFIIAEGLKGGEQVVVNGLQKARPGSVVKPVPVGGAPVAAATNDKK
jgi:membrane fusion protein (multidrug efflux system)